jgi:predicted RNase H-like HicB family nuclease
MTHYIALVHKDPDSAFGVQFLDVPGCFSAVVDMDDLISNATEALSLWAEDEVPPQPRKHDELLTDRDITTELAAGAFLISVPLVTNDTRSAFLAQAAKNEIER